MAHNEYYTYNQGTINGKILMNVCVFDTIVKEAIKKVDNISLDVTKGFTLTGSDYKVLGSIHNNNVNIKIHIKVKYGTNVSKATKELQKTISNEIKELTGVSPKKINIIVDEIIF